MASAFIRYMRAHGNTPGPTQRPTAAGLTAGALAAMPAVAMMWMTGAQESLSRVLGVRLWIVPVLQLVAMMLCGALYGRVFSRAANDRRGGWLFGISFGFLIWMLGPATALQWMMSRPLATGAAAVGLLGGHLLYGVALGSSFPFIHHRLQRGLPRESQKREKKESPAQSERRKTWHRTSAARG